jgi:dihydrofolate reductase
LTELGLIDEYELIVHPRFAGHGPTLFAGLSKPIDLKLVSRGELRSEAVAMRYERDGSRLVARIGAVERDRTVRLGAQPEERES